MGRLSVRKGFQEQTEGRASTWVCGAAERREFSIHSTTRKLILGPLLAWRYKFRVPVLPRTLLFPPCSLRSTHAPDNGAQRFPFWGRKLQGPVPAPGTALHRLLTWSSHSVWRHPEGKTFCTLFSTQSKCLLGVGESNSERSLWPLHQVVRNLSVTWRTF